MNNIDKIQWLRFYYDEKNYPINEFNIIGIRDERDIKKDVINDYLGFFTESEIFIVRGTTDPGVYWTLNKEERNKKGTFHLKEGLHEKIWTLGTHKGYEALVNDYKFCKPTKGWRDANYNFVKDSKDIEVCDYFGVNFHRMHPISLVDTIGKYSAGCQVVRDVKDFKYILDKFKSTNMFKKNNHCTVNYMLFNINEIPEGFLS